MKTAHLAAAMAAALFFLSPAFPQDRPDGGRALEYVRVMADDAAAGRDTGTRGYDRVAAWVAARFEEWGLEPAGAEGTYFQPFPFASYDSYLARPSLSVERRSFYEDMGDFHVLKFSGGGRVRAEVVFVGYGISAPEAGLDEYDGLDVHGRVVLVIDGAPRKDAEAWRAHSSLGRKIQTAADRGASGMLVCRGFGEDDRRAPSRRMQPSDYREGFPVFGVDERVADFLLRRSGEPEFSFERRIEGLQDQLDDTLYTISMPTGKTVRMAVRVRFDAVHSGKNVLAMLPGSDPVRKEEYILAGAHLDHLGIRYGEVYNGADDNASGVAAVMEAARAMAASGYWPKRTVLFACWAGEEHGLRGSRHFAEHPPIPLDRMVVNFNLDMVGIGESLGFGGTYYGPRIWRIVQEGLDQELLDFLQPGRGGAGGSDHTPFLTKGVPAFFLITRPWTDHRDYHRPEDDVWKIDAELLGRSARVLYEATKLVADADADIIGENRLPVYLFKSSVVVNPETIPYAPEHRLQALEEEGVDVQFVEVPLDTPAGGPAGLVRLVESLDEVHEEGDLYRGALNQIFSSRRSAIVSLTGLRGAGSVKGDLLRLRTAGKLGIQFFVLDGADGDWVDADSGLTDAGAMAVTTMNNEEILVICRGLDEETMSRVMDVSRYPVLLAGIEEAGNLSDSFLAQVREDRNLIALSAGSPPDTGKIVEFAEKIGYSSVVVSGDPAAVGTSLRELTAALLEAGVARNDIEGLLGANFRPLFEPMFEEGTDFWW